MKQISVLSLCLLVFGTAPGSAEEAGQAALDAWIENNRDFGLVLRYGSVSENGDQVIIKDLETSYKTSFQFEDGDGKTTIVDIEYGVRSPEVVATNLAHDDDGLSADRLEYGKAIDFEIEIAIDGNAVLTYTGNIEDYQISGVFWPHMQPLPKTLKGSTREWISWFASLADIRIDNSTAGFMTFRVSTTEDAGVEGAFSTEIEMNGFELQGMWDGRVASYSVGKFQQETNYNLDNGAPYSERVTMDSSKAMNVDFLAILDLFDPKPAGKSEYVEVIESASTSGYRAESDLYEFFIERIAYENVAIRSPETDLIAFIEQALSGREPNESEVLVAVLDLYRSFSIGSFSMQDLLIGFDADSEVGSGGIGRVVLTDLSSEGLGEFAVEEVDLDAGEQGSFRLGRFAIGNIEFAPYGPIKEFTNNSAGWDNPDPLEVARIFTPRSIAMELKKLVVASPELFGNILLDNYKLELGTVVPPIPTHVVFSTSGLELPVAFLNDSETEALLKAAGIDVLRLSENLSIKWNEATEDLVIDNFVFELGDVGRVQAKASLGGLPKTILQNPMQLEAAIATLNIKSLEIELQNNGGVQTALALSAADADVSEGMMKEALLMQLEGALSQIGNDAFSAEVMAAARAFFDDPKKLRLRIAPGEPVPVSQIMSDAMIAPDALPERLGVTVEANR